MIGILFILFLRQRFILDLFELHNRAVVVLLQREIALCERILLVDVIHHHLVIHFDDDVVPIGDDVLRILLCFSGDDRQCG